MTTIEELADVTDSAVLQCRLVLPGPTGEVLEWTRVLDVETIQIDSCLDFYLHEIRHLLQKTIKEIENGE